MVKIIKVYEYKPGDGTLFIEPSQTRQSDYEDINSLVARVIRGEIVPPLPDEYEYDEKVSNADILSSDHPLDSEVLDISDFGSLHQDDIREQIEDLFSGNVTHQEQEQSGANQQSSSDATVPVDNIDENKSE